MSSVCDPLRLVSSPPPSFLFPPHHQRQQPQIFPTSPQPQNPPLHHHPNGTPQQIKETLDDGLTYCNFMCTNLDTASNKTPL
ncbi:hypothetical protein M758_12G154600 [Ceratodon purpureus]|nr:hypothetical protein M758_12G154600 [Ceratodon purpureus]